MSTFNIKGSSCLLKTTILGDNLTIICLKGFSLNVVADLVDTLGPGDGQWSVPDYDLFRYTILFNGITRLKDANITGMDVFDAMLNMQEIPFSIIYPDSAGNIAVISGTAISTNALFDRTSNNLLNDSFTLTGKGRISKFVPDETNTIVFKLSGSNFSAGNLLTESTLTYLVNAFTVMSLTNALTNQQVAVIYSVPKLGGGSYGADYGQGIHVGLSGINIISAVSAGSNWRVTLVFDYTPATSNKTFNIVFN